MAALDTGVFNSKQFVFVVGESRTEFPIHAAIVAQQSKALDILINGPMAEASDGKVVFDDVSEETFTRFCQFAYAGNYTTPDFKTVELSVTKTIATTSHNSFTDNDYGDPPSPPGKPIPEPILEPAPEPVPEEYIDDGWGQYRPRATHNKKGKGRATSLPESSALRKSLNAQSYDTKPNERSSTSRCDVRPNSGPEEDYTPVLLGHAQLYVFAEKWGIDALKTLALSKLHKTLTSFTLYAVRRADIVDLLQYAYSNDNTPDRGDNVDGLRALVMLYTGCEVESLIQCPEFLALIGEGGQLAQDLVRILMKRIK